MAEDVAVTFSRMFCDQYKELVDEFEKERKAAVKNGLGAFKVWPDFLRCARTVGEKA